MTKTQADQSFMSEYLMGLSAQEYVDNGLRLIKSLQLPRPATGGTFASPPVELLLNPAAKNTGIPDD